MLNSTMNTQAFHRFLRIPQGFFAVLVALVFAALAATPASAGPNDVLYQPLSKSVEGIMPYSTPYTVSVLSPANYPAGDTRTINLELSVTTFTEGDEATALSYVTFLDTATQTPITSLTFTGPNQARSFTVRVAIPLIGISGAGSSATFAYHIATSNWGTMSDGSAVVEGGSNINAIASVDPSGDLNRLPPLISITTPADGQVFTPASLPATIPMSFLATARAGFPVVSVDATLDGVPLVLTTTPAGPATSVTGTASLVIPAAGTYTIRANAYNSVGSASDSNTFTVTFGGPPVAVINTPANNASYTLRTGSSLTVPYTFTATSTSGGITGLDVKVDGLPVTYNSSPLGVSVVTGQTDLVYTTGGAHTVSVSATNATGTSVPATADFTISVITPVPAISINLTGGATYTIPSGATSINIPFTLASTSTNGFTVDAVTATWSGAAPALSHNPSLGTSSSVTSSGTLLNVGPGTYTINATTTSAGIVAPAAPVTFTVNAAVQQPLPTVVINTPTVGSTYTLVYGGGPLSIPLTFTGTSNATGGVITALTAKLGTTALVVTPTNLGQKVATGAATLTISTPGTYTINVTAVDAYGTATASRNISVTLVYPKNICGRVFFDANYNGVFDSYDDRRCGSGDDDRRGSRSDRYSDRGDCDDNGDRKGSRDREDDYSAGDFGLGGITVKLLNSANVVIATQVTAANGSYCFTNIVPGNYSVTAVAPSGYGATTQATRAVTVATSHVTVRDIGFGLKHSDIKTHCATGKSSTYWRNEFNKVSKGDRTAQISSTTCNSHVKTIGSLSLDRFDGISLKSCISILSTGSTSASDQLSKELLAAQINYANGAYLNGNKTLTYCFIQWGERVLKERTKYSTSYTLWAKAWFQAYNNSEGGRVAGPN